MPLPLETERLVLRPFEPEDLRAIHERVYGDPAVMRYIGDGTPRTRHESREALLRYIAQQERAGYSLWALLERDTGEIVGDCGLMPYAWEGPEVEIGYRLARPWWGLGYATEAARAALAFGFAELGLRRILGVTHPENRASQRVLEKIGMRCEGRAPYRGSEVVLYAALRR